MSYLFFAFWVLASYVRILLHIPRIRLQFTQSKQCPTSPHVHNNYHPNNWTIPLPLSIFHPSWPIPSWWKNQPSPGEGGGVHAHPLSLYIYHHVQSCGVHSSWEGRYTPPPPISALPLYTYVLCDAGFLYRVFYFVYVMECKSRIHELTTISLRFLRIILTVFRLEVSVYNVHITNQF